MQSVIPSLRKGLGGKVSDTHTHTPVSQTHPVCLHRTNTQVLRYVSFNDMYNLAVLLSVGRTLYLKATPASRPVRTLLFTPKVCVHVAVSACVLEEDIWNSNANTKGSFPSPLGTRHLCKPLRHFGSAARAETARTAACQLMLIL